jgi:hypothetical protein
MTEQQTHTAAGSTLDTPADVGDIVVIERHTTDGPAPALVLVGIVTATTRQGKITEVDAGDGPAVAEDFAAVALHLVPRRQIDTAAAMAEVHALAAESEHTQPFRTVEQARALLQAFRRDLDPAVLLIPPTRTAATQ